MVQTQDAVLRVSGHESLQQDNEVRDAEFAGVCSLLFTVVEF